MLAKFRIVIANFSRIVRLYRIHSKSNTNLGHLHTGTLYTPAFDITCKNRSECNYENMKLE